MKQSSLNKNPLGHQPSLSYFLIRANKKIRALALLGFLAFSAGVFSATDAHAIGISARPSELNFSATAGKETSARIRIKNPGNEVALFEVYPEEFEEKISASPAKFTLESGEEKDVLIKFKSSEDGLLNTNLAVVARSLDNLAGIGGGVKIPLQIQNRSRSISLALISEAVSDFKVVGILFFLAIMAGLAMLLRR